MRNETIALHAGFSADPTTKAVAVPIYQSVAYAFDSADHGAALFNLEEEGFRYSRISNPTTAVLEERVAALEGGVAALAVSTGQTALYYAIANLADCGGNIVSVPQLYGTTHTLFAHVLPRQGITTRFAEADTAEAVERLIDRETRAVFCESVGNPAGNICDIEALAAVAHRHGVPLVVDNTVATPILLRPIAYGADVVVESLTKFMGGHGTTLGGVIVDGGTFPWADHAERFPMYSTPDPSYHGLVYTERFGRSAYAARGSQRLPAHDRGRSARDECLFCFCKGSKRWRFGSSGMSRTRGGWRNFCVRIRASRGSIMPALKTHPTTISPKSISADHPLLC